MAGIQMMAGNQFNSFDALYLSYFKQLLIGFQKADTVVEVFDRYDDDNSVKTAEPEYRAGSTTACKQYQVIGGRPVPPWKRFLDKCYIPRRPIKCVAEAVSLPRRSILCRRGDQNAADESKIFRRRVQGFRRRV